MIRLFGRHPYVMSILALSLCLAMFFAGRFTLRAIYWEAHRQEPVAAWMTVGYLGRSWGLDPREIDRLADLPVPNGGPLTLEEIAAIRSVPVTQVITEVEAAIAALLAEQAGATKDGKP